MTEDCTLLYNNTRNPSTIFKNAPEIQFILMNFWYTWNFWKMWLIVLGDWKVKKHWHFMENQNPGLEYKNNKALYLVIIHLHPYTPNPTLSMNFKESKFRSNTEILLIFRQFSVALNDMKYRNTSFSQKSNRKRFNIRKV